MQKNFFTSIQVKYFEYFPSIDKCDSIYLKQKIFFHPHDINGTKNVPSKSIFFKCSQIII